MRSVVSAMTSSNNDCNRSKKQTGMSSGLVRFIACVTVVLGLSMVTQGRVNAAQEAQASNGGDAEAGKAKSAACQACHGTDGQGISPDFPNLAGQVSGHIAQQLASYKSNDPSSRNNAIMLGMVAALSEQDMADLDAYYSSLEAKPGFIAEEDLEAAEKGARLYRGGAAELQIPACMSCHGPAGSGIPPLYPRVAGQSAAYLETQLLAFKSGERNHPMMGSIAFKLTPQQMREVSLFMRGLN